MVKVLAACVLVLVVATAWWTLVGAPTARVEAPRNVLPTSGAESLAHHDAASDSGGRHPLVDDADANADAQQTALLRHRGVTDRATTNAGRIVVRVLDSGLRPIAAARVHVSTADHVEHGVTDQLGRVHTSMNDAAAIDRIGVVDPTTAAEFATFVRWRAAYGLASDELVVRMPAERTVALRVVDAAGRPVPRLTVFCQVDRYHPPREHGLCLFSTEHMTRFAFDATTDASGIATFTAPEGIHHIGHECPIDGGASLGWLVVERGEATIEATLVAHVVACERELIVDVTLPPGVTARPKVRIEIPLPYRAIGAVQRVGRLDDLYPVRRSGQSDDGTHFRFREVPRLPVRVFVRADGCESFVTKLDAVTDELRVGLVASPPSEPAVPAPILRGTVRDSRGAPIADAAVSLGEHPDELVEDRGGWVVRSESDGRFEVELHGWRVAAVHHPEFETGIFGDIDPDAVAQERHFVMHPRVPVTGVVRDGHGRPAAGVAVLARRVPTEPAAHTPLPVIRTTTTSADGEFAFADTGEGRFEIRACPSPESGQLVGRVVAIAGTPATVVLGAGFDIGTEIRGVVVDAGNGMPIAGATVTVAPELEPGGDGGARRTFASVHATTDVDGAFRCVGAAPGRTILFAHASGYALDVSIGDTDAFARSPRRIALIGATRLRLRVLTSDEPARGIQVGIEGADGRLRTLTQSEPQTWRVVGFDGCATLFDVPRERVRVVVGRDLEDPTSARHTFDIDTRSLGDELVDIVVPR
jgi:hypothetical protein